MKDSKRIADALEFIAESLFIMTGDGRRLASKKAITSMEEKREQWRVGQAAHREKIKDKAEGIKV